MAIALTINGQRHEVDVPPETPLLWVIRDLVGLTGTKYGCGIAQCGACTVHVDGMAVRACQTRVGDAGGASVTTIEGVSGKVAEAVQAAWRRLDVVQCGYCQSGQIMQAAALLATNKKPTREEIVQHMNKNLCRCGTYNRIVRAIERAAREMSA